ncbi:hypothetical protein [Brevundimonas goettingensis]|uniref:Glycerophosphoryl diester phosphodiesterase membrane domain-containing protein n=1 Tax=Brevundimonas goettingensis TaxID=2774190 RepID=A0A975C104_9CAUL|nr:hypothetical protein [Brevundimonas goettingensis]QTC89775.1 hypothetical protein IFJ75_10665 [Brevundimonas goettingensis]
MSFSATEAAFEGFRVTRHHPMAVLAWALVSLVAVLGMAFIAMPILAPVADEFRGLLASGFTTEPSAAMSARFSYAAMATIPVSLVMQAILLPAIYRAMRQSGGDRFGFLRLGHDELRVFGAQVIVTLVSLLVSQGGEMLGTLAGGAGGAGLALLVEVVVMLASLYLSVRLVLVAPAAFAQGRIDLKAGWTATAGLFWPLIGMAIIAGFMAFVVMLLLGIVALPITVGMTGGAAGPAGLIAAGGLLIILSLALAMTTVILVAPFMVAYREARAPARA